MPKANALWLLSASFLKTNALWQLRAPLLYKLVWKHIENLSYERPPRHISINYHG